MVCGGNDVSVGMVEGWRREFLSGAEGNGGKGVDEGKVEGKGEGGLCPGSLN